MKKLLFNAFVIFGSAQLFIQSVIFFTGNKFQSPPVEPSSGINSDLPASLKGSDQTIDNIIKFGTGINNRITAHDFNHTVLPYSIAQINGLQLFYDHSVNLSGYGVFNTYNRRWRLVE